ncbi:MAG: BsuPI-related putative proteinase inhibitor [Acidimicrobiia bacterium]
MKRGTVLALGLALTVAACGSSDRQGAVGGAPLLTPAEAEGRSGLVAVQGFLWARPADDDLRLCEEVLESFPPQCGGQQVSLQNVDITEIAGIGFSQNVFWAEQVRARGELADGTLTVEAIELNSKDAATGLTYRLLVPVEVTSGSVEFVALLTNSSTTSVGLTFGSGQSADVVLTDPETGGQVYKWSADLGFDMSIREISISAGETLRFPLSDSEFDLPAGVFDLESWLTGSPAPPPVRGRIVVR